MAKSLKEIMKHRRMLLSLLADSHCPDCGYTFDQDPNRYKGEECYNTDHDNNYRFILEIAFPEEWERKVPDIPIIIV